VRRQSGENSAAAGADHLFTRVGSQQQLNLISISIMAHWKMSDIGK